MDPLNKTEYNWHVLQTIKRLIAAEDPLNPVADTALTLLLRERYGLLVNHSTVARKRQEAGYVNSFIRKKREIARLEKLGPLSQRLCMAREQRIKNQSITENHNA